MNHPAKHAHLIGIADVGQVFVYPPATQGAAMHDQSNLEEILSRIRGAGVAAEPIDSIDTAIDGLKTTLRPDDVILILTSGYMGGMVQDIPDWLDAHF